MHLKERHKHLGAEPACSGEDETESGSRLDSTLMNQITDRVFTFNRVSANRGRGTLYNDRLVINFHVVRILEATVSGRDVCNRHGQGLILDGP
jgi:hypothetical protein